MSKIKKALKEEQNQKAIELAFRNEESIIYDSNYPLVINKDIKIKSIQRMNEVGTNYLVDEDGNYYEEESCECTREVKISFVDDENELYSNGEKIDFELYISTDLSLDELEKELEKCEDYTDIELLTED